METEPGFNHRYSDLGSRCSKQHLNHCAKCLLPYYTFFLHSSVHGHLGRFQILAIMDNAAMIMGLQMTPRDTEFIPLDKFPEVGLLDPKVVLGVGCYVE